jgi:hypothetical protein
LHLFKKVFFTFAALILSLNLSGCILTTVPNDVVATNGQSFVVSVSGDANENFSPSIAQTVVSASVETYSVNPNLGFVNLNAVGGTCPVGSWDGNQYVTGVIVANCSVIFSATVNPYLVSQNVTPAVLTATASIGMGITSNTQQIFRNGSTLFLIGYLCNRH